MTRKRRPTDDEVACVVPDPDELYQKELLDKFFHSYEVQKRILERVMKKLELVDPGYEP